MLRLVLLSLLVSRQLLADPAPKPAELACAAKLPQAPKVVPRPPVTQERIAKLAALTSDALVRQATPAELVDHAVLRLSAIPEDATLTPAEADVWAIAMYQGEIHNGGHAQFFRNTEEPLATRAAMARVGCADVLPILDCALTAFPARKPARDPQQRAKQLGDRPSAQFSKLDDRWSPAWCEAALAGYIRKRVGAMPHIKSPTAP